MQTGAGIGVWGGAMDPTGRGGGEQVPRWRPSCRGLCRSQPRDPAVGILKSGSWGGDATPGGRSAVPSQLRAAVPQYRPLWSALPRVSLGR